MNTAVLVESDVEALSEVDFLEELSFLEEIRLRTWARKNYAPADERDTNWHPVILDEMLKRDAENN
jgi:hypothetical protein